MKLFRTIMSALCLTAAISCTNSQQQANTSENGTDMKYENKVIENIMTRRSIRKYQPQQIEVEKLNTIIECGINAPNAINKQSWEVRVLNSKESVAKLKESMVGDNSESKVEMVEGCFRGAPAVVVVANDVNFPFSVIDCGLMCENIMLSAWSLGIGSVCLGSPVGFIKNSPKAMEILGFSEGYQPVICIGLGYPDETPEAKPRDMGKVKVIE